MNSLLHPLLTINFDSLPLLLSQKNWSCASQDDSLLPPTALAELTVGNNKTSVATKLHLCHLFSLFCSLHFSLPLNRIPPLQLTKKIDVGFCPLWTNWIKHFKPLYALQVPEIQSLNHLSRYQCNNTTPLNNNTTMSLETLCFTFLEVGLTLIWLIRMNYGNLLVNIFHKWLVHYLSKKLIFCCFS